MSATSGAGGYRVEVSSDQIAVIYDGLGANRATRKSALVVRLDVEPRDLYVEIHLAS